MKISDFKERYRFTLTLCTVPCTEIIQAGIFYITGTRYKVRIDIRCIFFIWLILMHGKGFFSARCAKDDANLLLAISDEI
jgi:hypothetical protein